MGNEKKKREFRQLRKEENRGTLVCFVLRQKERKLQLQQDRKQEDYLLAPSGSPTHSPHVQKAFCTASELAESMLEMFLSPVPLFAFL